jgi:hypothetical protein
MDGAADRARLARAAVWESATLIRAPKMVDFHDFTGLPRRAPAPPDWQAELAAWESYAGKRH